MTCHLPPSSFSSCFFPTSRLTSATSKCVQVPQQAWVPSHLHIPSTVTNISTPHSLPNCNTSSITSMDRQFLRHPSPGVSVPLCSSVSPCCVHTLLGHSTANFSLLRSTGKFVMPSITLFTSFTSVYYSAYNVIGSQ